MHSCMHFLSAIQGDHHSCNGWGSSPSQEHWWPADNAGPKQAVWTSRLSSSTGEIETNKVYIYTWGDVAMATKQLPLDCPVLELAGTWMELWHVNASIHLSCIVVVNDLPQSPQIGFHWYNQPQPCRVCRNVA